MPLLRWLAASGRRRWLGQPPPALEGSLAGNGKARVELSQADADEAGAPTRVGLVEEQGFLEQGVAGRQGPRGRAVLRGGGFPLPKAELAKQVLHGAHGQVQLASDRRTIQPVVAEGNQELTHRQGNRSRHGKASVGQDTNASRNKIATSPGQRKTAGRD